MSPLDPSAAAVYLPLILALLAVSLLLPPPDPERAVPRGPSRWNGFLFFSIVVFFFLLSAGLQIVPPRWPLDHAFGLFTAANGFAFGLAIALFLRAPRPRQGWKGFFLGVGASPHVLGLDLKMFSYRPSLVLLWLMNVSFATAQVALLGQLFPRLLLYEAFTTLYIAAYFAFEDQMRFTWDVQSERFGWMLVWGDYVLVPFFYSVTGWFLLDRTEPIGVAQATALIALYAVGFWLFRGANGQKHRFKLDPDARIWGRPAESLEGRLLISGFWGIGRKLNYTGELCLYSAWTLLTGFRSIVPYLLPLWLVALLAHRAARDDRKCRQKYGELWAVYCRRATFRMFPFLY